MKQFIIAILTFYATITFGQSNNGILNVDNYAVLKTRPGVPFMSAHCAGKIFRGDGFGGWYLWDTSAVARAHPEDSVFLTYVHTPINTTGVWVKNCDMLLTNLDSNNYNIMMINAQKLWVGMKSDTNLLHLSDTTKISTLAYVQNYVASHTLSGPTGATGASGLVGATGTSGSSGLQGNIGATGIQGSTGNTGATGLIGVTGLQGSTGSNGLIGVTGVNGITGTTGVQGIVGVTGQIGATGATGAVGATGSIGSTGAVGSTGTAGTNGINAIAYTRVPGSAPTTYNPITWSTRIITSSLGTAFDTLTTTGTTAGTAIFTNVTGIQVSPKYGGALTSLPTQAYTISSDRKVVTINVAVAIGILLGGLPVGVAPSGLEISLFVIGN